VPRFTLRKAGGGSRLRSGDQLRGPGGASYTPNPADTAGATDAVQTQLTTGLIAYHFTGNSLNATVVAANVTEGTVTAGAGAAENTATGYASSPVYSASLVVSATTAAAAITNNVYSEITLTPDSGFGLDLSRLRFNTARAAATTPRGVIVRSSLDGYTADLYSADIPALKPDWTRVDVDLSTLPVATGPITFRFYIYAPSIGAAVDFDDIVFDGAVVAATNYSRTPADTAGATDAVSWTMDRQVTVSDTAGATDTATPTGTGGPPLVHLTNAGDYSTASHGSAATTTTVVLNKPANVAVGDLLVALASFQNGVLSGTITESTGAWKRHGPDVVADNIHRPAVSFVLAVTASTTDLAKGQVAIGSLPASWTFQAPGTSGRATGLLFRVTRADLSDGVNSAMAGFSAMSGWNSGANNQPIPSFSRTKNNSLLVAFGVGQNTSAQAPPPSWTVSGYDVSQTGMVLATNTGGVSWSFHLLGSKTEAASGTEASVQQVVSPTPNGYEAWAIAIAGEVASTDYTPTPADTAGATDSVTVELSVNRTPSDTAGATDSATTAVAYERTVNDNAAATDLPGPQEIEFDYTEADSATATDAAAAVAGLVRAPADTAGATDAILRDRSTTAADSAAGSDSASTMQALAWTVNDTAGATDSATIDFSGTISRNPADTAAGSDAATAVQDAVRAPADVAGATDVATIVATPQRAPGDTAAGSDAVQPQQGLTRAASDTAGATDSVEIELSGSNQQSASDTAGATDQVSIIRSANLTPSDTAGATDSAGVGQTRGAADIAGATDSASAVQGIGVSVNDTAGAMDSTSLAFGRTAFPADVADATDVAGYSVAADRSVSDTAGVTDATSLVRGYSQGPADTAGATDQVSTIAALDRTLADSAAATDSVNVSLQSSNSQTVNDQANLTDQLAVVRSATLTPNDPAGATDALEVTRDSTKPFVDSAPATDQVSSSMAADRQLADVAGATDAVTVVIFRNVTVADTAAATDSTRLDREVAAFDTATGSDTIPWSRFLQVGDVADATDAVSTQRNVFVAPFDVAWGTDTANEADTFNVTKADTAGASDQATWEYTLVPRDLDLVLTMDPERYLLTIDPDRYQFNVRE
jgi:hypothetical protein